MRKCFFGALFAWTMVGVFFLLLHQFCVFSSQGASVVSERRVASSVFYASEDIREGFFQAVGSAVSESIRRGESDPVEVKLRVSRALEKWEEFSSEKYSSAVALESLRIGPIPTVEEALACVQVEYFLKNRESCPFVEGVWGFGDVCNHTAVYGEESFLCSSELFVVEQLSGGDGFRVFLKERLDPGFGGEAPWVSAVFGILNSTEHGSVALFVLGPGEGVEVVSGGEAGYRRFVSLP